MNVCQKRCVLSNEVLLNLMLEMIQFPGILLATLALIIPGIYGQCVDCSKNWHAGCTSKETGYYCEKGAEILVHELTEEQLASSTPNPHYIFDKCVPYPLHLEYVHKWCCFWSKEVGCQVAVHPAKYEFAIPGRYCKYCKDKCRCEYENANEKIRPWNWSYLGSISVMLVRFL